MFELNEQVKDKKNRQQKKRVNGRVHLECSHKFAFEHQDNSPLYATAQTFNPKEFFVEAG